MAVVSCSVCGRETLDGLRGRRRRYCSAACRHRAHRRRRLAGRATTPRRQGGDDTGPAPEARPGDLATFATWVRRSFDVDESGEALLGLLLDADRRYRQARDVLDRDGLTTADGRARPEAGIERDTRAAIQRLIQQLGLEENNDATETLNAPKRAWPPRRVS